MGLFSIVLSVLKWTVIVVLSGGTLLILVAMAWDWWNPIDDLFTWTSGRPRLLARRTLRGEPHWSPEPIRAWRYTLPAGSWKPNHDDWAQATCERESRGIEVRGVGTHQAPHLLCTCGFYALKDQPRPGRGFGAFQVELAGTIIEHELGYRAEMIRVVAQPTKC